MSAPLPTEIQSIHGQKYFGALLADGHHYRLESQSNVFWHTYPTEINTTIWRTSPTETRKPIQVSSTRHVPINTRRDSRPLSGNHYRFDSESPSNGYHYRYNGGLIQQKIIQESFTRNDIYKSREIIHFNAILQRAPRHHHSNIHTSITYTQSYAIKKMPKTKTKDTKFKK